MNDTPISDRMTKAKSQHWHIGYLAFVWNVHLIWSLTTHRLGDAPHFMITGVGSRADTISAKELFQSRL